MNISTDAQVDHYEVRSAVPVIDTHNSLYLQAKLLVDAISSRFVCAPEVVPSKVAASDRFGGVTVYHYGSMDAWAFQLAFRPGVIFVFHNVTNARYLWKWSPLVALRAVAANIQLSLLPKNLPWFAVSEFNAEVLRRKGFRDVKVVPCVVPEPRPASKSGHPSLLFVGRIAPNKNLLQLLESYVRLASGWSGIPPTLTIVGTRKRRCRYGVAFERRLAQVQKSYPVIWRNSPLSYSALQSLYATAWLYVSASLHEGFAVPVMEAIAAGTPALYLPSGGTESVLHATGCVSTAAMFCEEVRKHLTDSHLRDELLAHQRIHAQFLSPSRVSETLCSALQSYGASLSPTQFANCDVSKS